jgi:hypothetical protein
MIVSRWFRSARRFASLRQTVTLTRACAWA